MTTSPTSLVDARIAGYLADRLETLKLQQRTQCSSPSLSLDKRVLEASKEVASALRDPHSNTRRDLEIHDPGRKFVNFTMNDDVKGAFEFLDTNPIVLNMRHFKLLGATILHLAASKGSTKICEMLIDEKKMDPFVVDLIGRTPLHLAADGLFTETCLSLTNRMRDAMGEKAPQDMTGVTPAAAAALSGKKTVNKSEVARSLHRFGDLCLSPLPRNNNNNSVLRGNQQQRVTRYGRYEMPGFRGTMEDRAVEIVTQQLSLFAVFDGHGGSRCANECKSYLPVIFNQMLKDSASVINLEELCKTFCEMLETHLEQIPDFKKRSVLKTAQVGEEAAVYQETVADPSGTTCLLALMSPTHLAIANIGDSRACWFNTKGQARPLTIDQKPLPPRNCDELTREFCMKEKLRIESCGGQINERGYVVFPTGFELQMSRSLGDFYGKPKVLSSLPEITVIPRGEGEFCLLACDGIWDVMNEHEVAQCLLMNIANLDNACLELCRKCAMPVVENGEVIRGGSDDNLTTTLIALGSREVDHHARRILSFE